MNIIGLGQCGCNIAKGFEQYPQYDVYYINTEKIESKEYLFPELEHYVSKEKVNIGKTFLLKEQKSHEEYEENCPDFSKFFKKVKNDVLFILGGGGSISGACLKVLEYIKDCNITVLFVMPDVELLSEIAYLQNRATFFVLQEYARSGVFEKILLVDNFIVESTVKDLTILNRYDKINEFICSTMHMINVYNNQKPIVTTRKNSLDTMRLCSFGRFDIEEGEENLFFSLDNVSEKWYCYAIPEKQLKTDTELLKKITTQMKEKNKEKTKVSYSIYSTNYDFAYGYTFAQSSEIQKQ